MDSRTAQLLNEEKADGAAASASLDKLRQQALEGDVSLPRAQKYIAAAYGKVRDHLQLAMDTPTRGVGGKYKNWLRALSPELAATLAIRTVLRYAGQTPNASPTAQILCTKLGSLYELEVRIAEAYKVNPVYMGKITEQIKDRGTQSTTHIKKVYNFAYEQVMKGGGTDRLSQIELLHLGKFGIDACYQTGIIEICRRWDKGGQVVEYELSKSALEYLTGYDASDVRHVLDHTAGSMVCPPDDWDSLLGGGYLSDRRKLSQPLMSTRYIRPGAREEVLEKFTAENMPEVFRCANYLQSMDFALHEPTAKAIQRLWEVGGGAMGVPTKNPPVLPRFPFSDDWVASKAPEDEQEVLQAWKRQAASVYRDRVKWRSKVREIGTFLRISRSRSADRFWLPVFMDTRGRWYYRGALNPQGSDLAKATLHLARKKPLGYRGLHWLKVAVATHFGFDRARFELRARWTEQHWDAIERALDAPEDFPEVWGTDAPWCMYSAAWELREALRSGNPAEYRTGIVIHMDATASGLQHFAAMLRDPVGARYVNLVDSGGDEKADVYSQVSAIALRGVQSDVESECVDTQAMARYWLAQGVPRALAKKPVMTYVYGATLIGTAQDISDFLTDEGWEVPAGVNRHALCRYMAKHLFAGIAETIPAAAQLMEWLQGVVRSLKTGERMTWYSPTGFQVQHDYQDYEETRVAIRSCGLDMVLMRKYIDGVKGIRMTNAVAPNFVHALDAAHLTRTGLKMEELGHAFVAIHDSYGTHPSSVDTMQSVLREEFVRMYEETDVLDKFLWDTGAVGVLPVRGSLDIRGVLDSEFFFC